MAKKNSNTKEENKPYTYEKHLSELLDKGWKISEMGLREERDGSETWEIELRRGKKAPLPRIPGEE